DRGVSGAGIPLAIAALALEAANRRGGDFVADFSAGTAACVHRHANLLAGWRPRPTTIVTRALLPPLPRAASSVPARVCCRRGLRRSRTPRAHPQTARAFAADRRERPATDDRSSTWARAPGDPRSQALPPAPRPCRPRPPD